MDYQLATETVNRLLELPSPFDQNDWWMDDVAYLDGCALSHDDVAGLVSVLEAWAIDSDEAEDVFLDDDEGSARITAWRLVGKLKAVEALPAMLRCLTAAAIDDDESESWESAELPHAFVLLGPEVAEDLMKFAADASQSWGARVDAIESVRKLGDQHPTIIQSLSPIVVAALEGAAENHVFVNSNLMGLALDWKLKEAAESIEHAFSLNKIDCGYSGDWDSIREELGVSGLGLTMPEKPFNSIADIRRNMGIGTFSKQPLFEMGELDVEAAENYLNRACRAFAASSEGKRFLGEQSLPSNVRLFLDLAVNYLGVTVDSMTMGDVEEILLDLFPRKVSMEAEHCEEVIDELAAFWRFVDRVHDVEQASEIAKNIPGLSDEFHDAMTDTSNFGMAKSMVMMGEHAGFDMTTQEGLHQFMNSYNRTRLAHPPEASAPPPLSADQKRLDRKNRKKLLAAKTRSKKKR